MLIINQLSVFLRKIIFVENHFVLRAVLKTLLKTLLIFGRTFDVFRDICMTLWKTKKQLKKLR